MIEAVQDDLVVRDDDHRRVLLGSDPTQQVHHNASTCRVQRCRRLVREDDARPICERARNRYPLRLAARKLRRHSVFPVPNFEIIQQIDRVLARCRRAVPGQLQDDRDIVGCVEERQEVRILEDEADIIETESAQVGTQPMPIVDDFRRAPCGRY